MMKNISLFLQQANILQLIHNNVKTDLMAFQEVCYNSWMSINAIQGKLITYQKQPVSTPVQHIWKGLSRCNVGFMIKLKMHCLTIHEL
jgi:hypothetical protein